MAHRMDIELTSNSSDELWTWRAAGAKQPRGSVEAALVPDGAAVGSVLRAEVETTLDGTTITALALPRPKVDPHASSRIEVVGTQKSGPDVNVVLAGKSPRRRDDRGDRPRGGERPPRDGARRSTARRSREGTERPEQAPAGARTEEGRAPRRRTGPARPGQREPTGGGPRRLPTSSVYRNAALAELKPEQIPVAEQLIRGGIPAVRQAIEEQNARARADGRPEVTPAPLLALAEQLRPTVALATWKDRASVARNAGKDVPLRELRSIVAASSTVTLDDEGRELATALRTALDERVTALRERWVARITTSLDEGRVVDAVRASIRPPEPATRLTAELAVRLAEAAGAAMTAETDPDQWLALLEVVVDSPVRRSVKPAALPAGASEELLAAARKASGYVPELARLMGIPIPPPPGPRRPVPARVGHGQRAS